MTSEKVDKMRKNSDREHYNEKSPKLAPIIGNPIDEGTNRSLPSSSYKD